MRPSERLELLLDRLVAEAERALSNLARAAWFRFKLMGWVGRGSTVWFVLFGAGWLSGKLGLHHLAHELGSAAWFVLSVLVTALIIRSVWRNHATRPRGGARF